MEALTLEPQTAERLLIYSNDQEINRVIQEAQNRANILNRIAAHKVNLSSVERIATSLFSIGEFILEQQLKENPRLKELHDAGIKSEATLPEHLQRLKDDLTSWHNFKGYQAKNKFYFLKVDNTSATLDYAALERDFVQRGYKVYIEGEKLEEYREIEMICTYFEKNRMQSNQINGSSFLWSRIEPVGREKYKPRWQWFRERN